MLLKRASQVALVVKDLPANAGDIRDVGLIPELGRSLEGGHGNPLQYSCLENPHGKRSLVGYSPWGRKELEMTERLSTKAQQCRARPCCPWIFRDRLATFPTAWRKCFQSEPKWSPAALLTQLPIKDVIFKEWGWGIYFVNFYIKMHWM